jgi:hypothetical protein
MREIFSRTNALVGVCTFALSTGVATAGVTNLELNVSELTTGYNQTFNPTGTAGPLFETYGIGINQTEFAINGSINGSPDLPGASPALLSNTLSFANLTSQTLEFVVTMTLSMTTGSTPVAWNTSSAWVLTGPDSPNTSLGTLANMPLWSVSIDNNLITTMFDDPISIGGAGGTYNLNEPPQSGTFGPVQNSISIQLAFSLGADSTGGPTGAFTMVAPAPGALALFGAAFLVGGSRRRR